MAKFTISQERGRFNLQQDGITVAVISDCSHPVSLGIANRLNKAAEYYSNINKLKQQRDGLLESLKELAAQHACGCGHPACKSCDRDRMSDEAIAKAEGREP